MNFEINDRILQLIENLHITKNRFSNEIGISSSRMGNITAKRNNPDAEMLVLIAQRYRNINLQWLLLGEGPMFTDGRIEPPAYINFDGDDKYLLNRVVELATENGMLKEKIKHLQKQLGYTSQNLAAES